MNKLKLTENQFDRLMKFINETPYDKVINNTVKVGDIIRIEYRNSTSNFKVIDATHGQIIMDNIDSGSANINYRYFITSTSLHGTDLEIRRIHKLKEANKLNDIKSWKVLDVKDIKNIEVLRNNSVIDSVDSPVVEPKAEPKQDDSEKQNPNNPENIKILDSFRDRLLNTKENETIVFDLIDGTKITFCVASKNGLSFKLEVNDIEGNATRYKFLGDASMVELTFNNSPEQDYLDEILVKYPGEKVGLRLTIWNGESKEFKYIYFKDFQNGGLCDGESEASEEPEEEPVEDEKEVAKRMMNAIVSDPNMRNAFYKQPSLWNMIVGVMKGEKPKGTGIGPARDIIANYGYEKAKKKLGPQGDNFNPDKEAKFKFLKDVQFKNKASYQKNEKLYAKVLKSIDMENITLKNLGAGLTIEVLNTIPNLKNTFNVNIRKTFKKQTKGTVNDITINTLIEFISEPNSGYYENNTKTK